MKDLGTALKFIKEAFYYVWDRLGHFLRVSELFPDSWDPAQDAKKMMTIIYAVRSDKDANFTTAIAQNAKEDENLTGVAANKIRIKRITCQSDENLAWEIQLWETDTFDDVDLDLDSYKASVIFDTADAMRIGAANQWYYDSGSLDIPCEDLDGTFELHISLCNRSAAAKTAGANGEFVLLVEYEPTA
jgi:hypothetical protein